MTVHAHLRIAARHQAVHRRAVAARSNALGHHIDAGAQGRRRAPDDGRRADVRVDRRHGRRRVELHGARRPTSAGSPARSSAGSKIDSPRARCCTSARASGIPASRCRAGRSAATGATTACRSGMNDTLIADDTVDYGYGDARREHVHHRAGATCSASTRRMSCLPTRTSGTTCWRERRLPVNVDPLESNLEERGGARPAGRHLRTGPRPGRRLRAADQRRDESARARMDRAAVVPAPEHLFLIPGDSPMVPPAARLAAVDGAGRSPRRSFDVDPFAPREPPARQPVHAASACGAR